MKAFFALIVLLAFSFSVKAQQLCTVLGNPTAGICTDPANFDPISFCTSVNYEACIYNQNSTVADAIAQEAYDSQVGTLADNEPCKVGLKNYICALYFPQCDQGSSADVCLSTCKNFLSACNLDTDTCTQASSYGLTVEQNKKLPCTSSAFAIVPQLLVIVFSFAFIF